MYIAEIDNVIEGRIPEGRRISAKIRFAKMKRTREPRLGKIRTLATEKDFVKCHSATKSKFAKRVSHVG